MEELEFGSYFYEQDGSKKPIEWIVLEKRKGVKFIITKEIIDVRSMDLKDHSWKDSDLRNKWLKEFKKEAFTSKELNRIHKIQHTVSHNPMYKEKTETIEDDLFILSVDEMIQYFGFRPLLYGNHYLFKDHRLTCEPTPYASLSKRGMLPVDADHHCWYWLRDNGVTSKQKVRVDFKGEIDLYGLDNSDTRAGIRLACYIS